MKKRYQILMCSLISYTIALQAMDYVHWISNPSLSSPDPITPIRLLAGEEPIEIVKIVSIKDGMYLEMQASDLVNIIPSESIITQNESLMHSFTFHSDLLALFKRNILLEKARRKLASHPSETQAAIDHKIEFLQRYTAERFCTFQTRQEVHLMFQTYSALAFCYEIFRRESQKTPLKYVEYTSFKRKSDAVENYTKKNNFYNESIVDLIDGSGEKKHLKLK